MPDQQLCAREDCGKRFTPKRVNQKYCAPRCGKIMENRRRTVGSEERSKKPSVRTGEISREELLENELLELRRAARAARSTDVHAERVLGYIREAVRPAEVKFEPAERIDDGKTEHVYDLFLSDWHYGEVVDPEQVDGLNEFDTAVLERRVEEVYSAIVSFLKHRTFPVNKLHVALGGDMSSGGPGIHDEIRESNEKVASEQAVEVGALLGGFIERLVPLFNEIEVDGVSGNHPRMAKPHASKNVFDNFDWISYKFAETYLRSYDSVTCNFPRSGFVVQEIAGKSILLWHGDGIKTTMPGVPWGGVIRRTNELKKQYADRGVLLDGYKLGHFHQANVVWNGTIFMNGSLVGLNEYGMKNFGSGSGPCQLLMTWDAGHGRLTDISYITPR